jgi:hypothetical protein
LSLVTAIKQLSKYSKWVLQAAATHEVLVSQEVSSFRRGFGECFSSRAADGREQFGCRLKRKVRSTDGSSSVAGLNGNKLPFSNSNRE